MKLTQIELEGNKCKFCQRKDQKQLYLLESNYRLKTILCNHCMWSLIEQFNEARINGIEGKEPELKLIRWADHHYPPINLNENANEVARLVQEIKRLRLGKKNHSVKKGKKRK